MKRVFLTSIAILTLTSSAALAQSSVSSASSYGTASMNTNVSTVTSAVVNDAAGSVVDTASYSNGIATPSSGAQIGVFDPGRPDMGQIFRDYGREVYGFDETAGFGCGFSTADGSADCGAATQ